MSLSESNASSSASESEHEEDVPMQDAQSSGSESESGSDSDAGSDSDSDSGSEVDEAASEAQRVAAAAVAAAAEREAKKEARRLQNLKKKEAKSNGTPVAAAPATPAKRPATAPATAPSAAATTSSGSAGTPTSRLNPLVKDLKPDIFYHLGLSSELNLRAMFGDVRFVILSGSAVRAAETAGKLLGALGVKIPVGCSLTPIGKTERFSLYKVGPVISASHGMGKPSISILLHELTKLLAQAGCLDKVTYIRVGTSGGVGVDPGSVVVSSGAVNGALQPVFPVIILGKTVERPCIVDPALVDDIMVTAQPKDGGYNVVRGVTMATDDFYEGQGRLDGALLEYTHAEKMAFLARCHAAGVRNIEMESDCIVAFCRALGIPVAVICCTILDRLAGDQVNSTPEQLVAYADHAVQVTIRFIQRRLNITPPDPKVLVGVKALKKSALRVREQEARIMSGMTAVAAVAGSGTDFQHCTMSHPHVGAKHQRITQNNPAVNPITGSVGGIMPPNSASGKKKKHKVAAAAAASTPATPAKPSTPAQPSSSKKKQKQPPQTPKPTTAPAIPAPAAATSGKKKAKHLKAKEDKAAAVSASANGSQDLRAVESVQTAAAEKAAVKVLHELEKAEAKTAATMVKDAQKAEKAAAKLAAKAQKAEEKSQAKAAKEASSTDATNPSTPTVNRRHRKREAEAASAAAAAAAAQKALDDAAALAAQRAADLAKFDPDAASSTKPRRPNKNERMAIKKAQIAAALAAGNGAAPAAAPAAGEKRGREEVATVGHVDASANGTSATSEKKAKKQKKEKA